MTYSVLFKLTSSAVTGPNFGSDTEFSGPSDESTEIVEEDWSSTVCGTDGDDTCFAALFGNILSGCASTIRNSAPNRLAYSV